MSLCKQDPNLSLSLAVREYESLRSNSSADAVMQELSDVNIILSKGDVEQKQFVLAISKILSLEESRSPLAWSILNFLLEICNAAENERILKHLQNLTPMVSKLVLAAGKVDRKVCALTVLQTLTYGIEVPHADAYVAPLISSLVDCSKPGNESRVIQLSLSVLANLLHRNKVVLFSLMQTVNVKDFMNSLFSVRSNVCKMEVCKLLFLLEELIHEKPNESEVLNFIRVTFATVIHSGSSKNISNLQHCILFFSDMVKENKINISAVENPWFSESIQKIIDLLVSGLDKSELGCASLLFKFLRVFIMMDIPSFSNFHEAIMEQGVAWTMKHRSKASEMVMSMQCILASQLKSQSHQGVGMTGDELVSVFVPLLKDSAGTVGNHHFLTALLDFLSTALEVELYNIVLKEYLEIETVEALIASVPSNVNIFSNFNAFEPVITMHINVLHFVCKIATSCNKSWINFYSCLFRDVCVITTLAAALLYGSSDSKGKVLSLVSSVGFPGESMELLAKSMAGCGRPSSLTRPENNSNDLHVHFQVASTYAEVNKMLRTINNLISSKQLEHLADSKVLKLYQYKEQVNADYQKSLVASLSRASVEKSLLQEELYLADQITAELRQELHGLRPAFEEMRDKCDSALKALEETERSMCSLKKRLNEEITVCQSQIQNLKEDNEKLHKEGIKSSSQLKILKEQLVEKAEENSVLKDEHEKLTTQVANYSKELEEMDSELKSKIKQNIQLEQDKKVKEREIVELQRIRDTVFELTGGRKKF